VATAGITYIRYPPSVPRCTLLHTQLHPSLTCPPPPTPPPHLPLQVDKLDDEKLTLQRERSNLQRQVTDLAANVDKLNRDKVSLEQAMEMEEENIVNRLQRQLEAATHNYKLLEQRLEAKVGEGLWQQLAVWGPLCTFGACASCRECSCRRAARCWCQGLSAPPGGDLLQHPMQLPAADADPCTSAAGAGHRCAPSWAILQPSHTALPACIELPTHTHGLISARSRCPTTRRASRCATWASSPARSSSPTCGSTRACPAGAPAAATAASWPPATWWACAGTGR
jgi:hypothetical protein